MRTALRPTLPLLLAAAATLGACAARDAASLPAGANRSRALAPTEPRLTGYPTGLGRPVAVATGDLDGDGIPDVVTALGTDDAIAVRLGQAGGALGAEARFATGEGPQAVVLADLDGDGKLDAVTADSRRGDVAVLLGAGDGSFGAPKVFPAGRGARALAVADLDGDGKLDVVTADRDGDQVSVLLGVGGGALGAARALAAGRGPQSLALGDLDGDGKLDLAVSCAGTDTVAVLFGRGDGTFDDRVHYGGGAGRVGPVALVDLDGDGRLDVVHLAHLDGPGAARSLLVLYGAGQGAFAAPIESPAPFATGALATADLDGDGLPDVAYAATDPQGAEGRLAALLNLGARALAAPTTSTLSRAPLALALADLDGDGKLDAVAAGERVAVALGQAGGAFADATGYGAPTGQQPSAAATADFNGDGLLDLATAGARSGDVSILLGTGNGRLGPAATFPAGAAPVALAVGDFDHDQRPDLVTANQGSGDSSLLLNQGGGAFSAPLPVPLGAAPRAVAVADFNHDGLSDLVVLHDQIAVLLGKQDPSFQQPLLIPSPAPQLVLSAVAVGDLNGDGQADLAVTLADPAGGSGGVAVFFGKGDGTFLQPALYPTPSRGLLALAAGDLNGDGAPDLVVTGADQASILLNLGQGGLFGQAFASPQGGTALALADLDGDGRLDLATALGGGSPCGGEVRAASGHGDGSFDVATRYAVEGVGAAVLAADFLGGGGFDLVFTRSTDLASLVGDLTKPLGGGGGSCGALGAACCDVSPVDHCNAGLGCDTAIHVCAKPCGGDAEVCCDGPDTNFIIRAPGGGLACPMGLYCPPDGSPCFRPSWTSMCKTGGCSPATRRCAGCGTTAGAACCGPDPTVAVATCRNDHLVCQFSSSAETAGTCVHCGAAGERACDGGCDPGLVAAKDRCCKAKGKACAADGECCGGLACTGGVCKPPCSAGAACKVPGQKGPCQDGKIDCGGLDPVCKQVVFPKPDDNCNGIDDDCNGKIDDKYVPHACTQGGITGCQSGFVADGKTVCKPGGKEVCLPEYCTTCDNSSRCGQCGATPCTPGVTLCTPGYVCKKGATLGCSVFDSSEACWPIDGGHCSGCPGLSCWKPGTVKVSGACP